MSWVGVAIIHLTLPCCTVVAASCLSSSESWNDSSCTFNQQSGYKATARRLRRQVPQIMNFLTNIKTTLSLALFACEVVNMYHHENPWDLSHQLYATLHLSTSIERNRKLHELILSHKSCRANMLIVILKKYWQLAYYCSVLDYWQSWITPFALLWSRIADIYARNSAETTTKFHCDLLFFLLHSYENCMGFFSLAYGHAHTCLFSFSTDAGIKHRKSFMQSFCSLILGEQTVKGNQNLSLFRQSRLWQLNVA